MTTRQKIALITACVAAIFASFIFTAQFHGEDELGVYVTADQLAQAFKTHDWFTIARVLVGSYHPPGRFLLATASFLIFNPSPFALRLPTFVIWVAACVLAADIAQRLAGAKAGLITGVLLGASGLFNLEALGFGHGVLTFWVMLFVWLHLKNPKQYFLGGIILAAGFLWFTSLLPVIGMYHLYYAWRAIKEKTIKRYMVVTLPFVVFYVLYYLIFLGVPYYAWTHGIRSRPVGQLHQNLARAGSSHLNIGSLIENLKGLNWYHVPFISWLILLAGLVWQWRHKRELFLILTPYALLFSFYIIDNTLQHFLSYYIWLIPFGVAAIWQWGSKHSRDWQGAMVSFFIATCIGTAVFGYIANTRRYNEANYPYTLAGSVFGSGKWRMNLVRPLPQIAADLAQHLRPEAKWTVTIDGPLPMFYFPDSRFVPFSNNCQELQAVIRSQHQPQPCDRAAQQVITYPGSGLELVLF